MISKTILHVALALGCTFGAVAGDITGKITLNGTPPPEKEITPLANDPNCGKLVTGTPMTIFYLVGENGGLADAVVVLKGVEGAGAAPGEPLEIDQKGCLYIPYVAAVQTGQKIIVKNSDPVLHNVHTMPTVAGNETKNLAQMPNGPDLEFSFAKPEEFLKFKCDVHPWMFSYVTVVDHPYFDVSGKDGSFKIADVPPGKYTLEVKHRKAAPDGVSKEIEVTEDGATVDLAIDL